MRHQSQPQPLLPHERVRPGCILACIPIIVIYWMIYTHIIGNTSISWQWVFVTPTCLAFIILCIVWGFYTAKRRREARMTFTEVQQHPQTFLSYQEQQMQKFYASLEAQQRMLEEQRRRERLAREEQQSSWEEEWRRQKEQERKEQLAIIQLSDLLVLSPKQFEYRVADLLVSVGYRNVQRTGGSGDLMADITCTSPEGEKVVVQCKRYERVHKVSSPEIQKFAGMVFAYHKADKAIFITTSSFTEPATKLGKALHIELIDGEKLCQFFEKRA